jgi:antitoxin ParD1/3/4
MNISLTPQLEQFVQERLKSGRYASASEVMRAALRLLESYDRALESGLHSLKADVEAGLRQLDEGKARPFDDAALERIKKAGREALAASQKSEP